MSGRDSVKRPFTVCVEGNIGSGKTTFLNHFNKNETVAVFAEPLDYWTNCGGHNLLELMYSNPNRWGYTFESYVQLTMLKTHQEVVSQPVKLMERSIYSVQYCFVEKMAKDGLMPEASKAVIEEWFKYLTTKDYCNVDLIVYLRTSPEVAYDRILKRNRSEEKTVLFEYIQELHKMHEDWLFHKTTFSCPAPVVVLNADLDKSVIVEEYQKYETKILNGIATKA